MSLRLNFWRVQVLLLCLIGLGAPGESLAVGPPAMAETVVVIVVDGLRPDAIKLAKAPSLDHLIKRGASSLKAQTVNPSLTLPALTSLFTGLTVEQHGIDWNEFEPERGYLKAPTIFELSSFYGSKWGAFFANKEKLMHIGKPDIRMDLSICSTSESHCTAKRIAGDVISYYKTIARDPKPSLFIVHIADADTAGHTKGWMSKSYLHAVEACDRAIGFLVKGFQDLGIYDRTTFIVTADHGGHNTTHGTSAPEDLTIPWIAAGPGIKKGYEIKRTVSIIDTPATIMQAFGITDYYVEWSSRSIEEIFEGSKAPGSGNPTQ